MAKALTSETLVKLLATLLLALFTWNAKGLCDRVTRLEHNQYRMMEALKIAPVADGTPRNPGILGGSVALGDNYANQTSRKDGPASEKK